MNETSTPTATKPARSGLLTVCEIAFPAVLLLAVLAVPSSADCYRAPIVVAKPVVAAAVVTPVVATPVVPVVATFVPITVAVPAYTAVYTPGAAAVSAPSPAPSPAPAASQAQTAPQPDAKIIEALNKLADRLDRLEKSTAPQTSPVPSGALPQTAAPTKPASVASLFGSRCAACHDKAAASEKGGGLALTDGAAVLPLTDAQVRKTLQRTFLKTMPPKKDQEQYPALSDEEYGALMAWASSR